MKDIMASARQFARQQGRLGVSPGEFFADGSFVLCAGSCIAFAGLVKKRGYAVADAFVEGLREEKKGTSYLADTLEGLGIRREIACSVILENDRHSAGARLDWFMHMSADG